MKHIFNFVRVGLLLALALVVSSCTPANPVAEAEYGAKIVGNWLGTVGDMKESITFSGDGSFIAQSRQRGFISNTLSQGVTGTLKVDGKVVATKRMEKTLPIILRWDEGFDIGSDTLTGVNDADYKPPFPLTAQLNKLTIKVDRPQLSPAEIKKLETAIATTGVSPAPR